MPYADEWPMQQALELSDEVTHEEFFRPFERAGRTVFPALCLYFKKVLRLRYELLDHKADQDNAITLWCERGKLKGMGVEWTLMRPRCETMERVGELRVTRTRGPHQKVLVRPGYLQETHEFDSLPPEIRPVLQPEMISHLGNYGGLITRDGDTFLMRWNSGNREPDYDDVVLRITVLEGEYVPGWEEEIELGPTDPALLAPIR